MWPEPKTNWNYDLPKKSELELLEADWKIKAAEWSRTKNYLAELTKELEVMESRMKKLKEI